MGWRSECAGTVCASVSQVNTNLSVVLLFALTRFPPPTSAETDSAPLLTHREGTSQSRKRQLVSSHSRDLPGTLTILCLMQLPMEMTATLITQEVGAVSHFLGLGSHGN